MTNRPPEMETLARVPHYVVRLARNDGFDSYTAPAYLAEHVDAAIRSLRVKLFRERARWHHECDRATRTVAEFCESDALFSQAHLEARAANRFMRIADAIERGEK